MHLINLTPHAINEATTGQTFAPSGIVARVSSVSTPAGEASGCPIFEAAFGDVDGLPEPAEGIIYIVSGMVLDASPRTDLVAPGELLRDAGGFPVGCKGFRRKAAQPVAETTFAPYQVMGVLRGPKAALDAITII